MSIRQERFNRLVQREIADLLNNEFFEASQSMVTVTNVRMTKDFGIAYVYVSVLGDNPGLRKIALRRLEDLTPDIRQSLAARIRHQVRRIPEIRFFLDETQQHAQHMEKLFDQIRTERSGREEEEGESPFLDDDAEDQNT
jgi:ribosome-binding factor A